MVRNYTRVTDRQKWSIEAMKQAIAVVISNQMGLDRASAEFAVPKSTLARYVKKRRESPEFKINKKSGKFKCVFTEQQEVGLTNYIKDLESRLFTFSTKDLRSLAYQWAMRIGVENNFNRSSAMAGHDWINGFLKRQPDLRKPGPQEGCEQLAATQFQWLLTDCIHRHQLTADRIYSCDEIVISVNPKGRSKIIPTKGKHYTLNETVNVQLCFSAGGAYMPPMLCVPRKINEAQLGFLPGGWDSQVTDSGWITSEVFFGWFKKFIRFSKAATEDPVLLLLDAHSCHMKNLRLIDVARENGVLLLCFPPQRSHHLQPLDIALRKPISACYEEDVGNWMKAHPGEVLNVRQIAAVFGDAFSKAANVKAAADGFRESGVWPPDTSVFCGDAFLAIQPDIPRWTSLDHWSSLQVKEESIKEEENTTVDQSSEKPSTSSWVTTKSVHPEVSPTPEVDGASGDNINHVEIKQEMDVVSEETQPELEDFQQLFLRVVNAGGYSPKQVINLVETGLFWNTLPRRTIENGQWDKCSLLLGGNAAGDLKLKPLMVYHTSNPRSLSGYSKDHLPVTLRSNRNAALTSSIFLEYFNAHLHDELREYCEHQDIEFKVLLVLENAPTYPEAICDLSKNICVLFMPSDAAHLLQPMDQGILTTFKALYLARVFERLLNDGGGNVPLAWSQFNVKNAVDVISEAWAELTDVQINAMWRNLWTECVYANYNPLPDIVSEILGIGKDLGFQGIREQDVGDYLRSHDDKFTGQALDGDAGGDDGQAERMLSPDKLWSAFQLLGQALKILDDNDPYRERSSKVLRDVNTSIVGYRELHRKMLRHSPFPYP